MRTLKIMLAAAVIGLSLSSCKDGELPFVKRQALEASENENKELKSSLQEIQKSYAKQNEELNSILSELSSISLSTSKLQLNVESDVPQYTQAEMISDNIESVKKRIDKLEKEAKQARKLNKDLALAASTIQELRNTITNQENEIRLLKETLSQRDETIRGQKDTISVQNFTIQRQQDDLRKNFEKQVEMIFQAGLEFETIADEGNIEIKRRKDRVTVTGYRRSIYEKALTFYQMASDQGHMNAKKKITEVQDKIAALPTK